MKKLLIASTALVATSGVAMADVSLNGAAQFGVIYFENGNTTGDELFLDWEIQFNIVGSGETDGGLGFGASVEVETDSNDAAAPNQQSYDGEVFVSGGFGTLTVGEVDVATDGMGVGDIGYDGIGVDDTGEVLKVIGTANIEYRGSFGGLDVIFTTHSSNEDYAIFLGYDFGMFSAGLGYAADDATDTSTTALDLAADLGDFGVALFYHESDNLGTDEDGFAVEVTYALGAYDLNFVFADNSVAADPSYGLGVGYDLGGGASLAAGIGSVNDEMRASFGINMSF